MQIGNNRPSGPRPEDRQKPSLDPDLTRANREGLEKTAARAGEQTREAAEERSPARQAEARRGRDTFERSREQDDAGSSVEERLRNARTQNTRARRATRIENARAQQKGQRIENARVQNTEARHETRVENARAQRTKAIENTQGPGAARIENARAQQKAERIENARVQQKAERVENARAQQKAERVENAREQRTKVDASRAGLEVGGLSRESVQLSSSVERLMSNELPGPGGAQESTDARQARFEALRQAYQNGELNSPARLRQAAARLLGGE
jgi:hypothetical protein